VQHGYHGLFHDAQLYLLQALAHLHPQLYGNDPFLRFGSQDSFTVFPALHAALIDRLGIEPATALLTALSHIALIGAIFILARALMPLRLALLATALVVAIPGDYGDARVFTYLEDFLTPRLLGEALVLAALTALLAERTALMGILLICAAAVHPLMAAGGFVLAGTVYLREHRLGRAAWLSIAIAAATLITLYSLHTRQWVFDDQWWRLVQRTRYLFVAQWSIDTWCRTAVPLITLATGACVLERSPQRTICTASLAVGVLSIVATLIGADWLRIVPITQIQPWRGLWLSNLVALLLLPAIEVRVWNLRPVGRVIGLLLISLWVLRDEVQSLYLAPVALGFALAAKARVAIPPERQRPLEVGAWAALALSLTWALINVRMSTLALHDESAAPELLRTVRTWTRDGLLPALAVVAMFTLSNPAHSSRPSMTGLRGYGAVIGTVVALAVLAPMSLDQWRHREFTDQTFDRFAPWREAIPRGTEVLWIGNPVPAWILLQRPSYLSNQQVATQLFSRAAGMELEQRATSLALLHGGLDGLQAPSLPTSFGTSAPNATLPQVCAASDVRFIVTRLDLGPTPVLTAPTGLPAAYRRLRLYHCDH
jgi:hypothetical protein